MALPLVYLLLVWTFLLGADGTNLLQNGGFEDPNLGTPWSKAGCSWDLKTTEKHTGNQSVYISNRAASWAGLRYDIGPNDGISAGKIYAFSAYIKLENLADGLLNHTVQVTTKETLSDNSFQHTTLSLQKYVRPGSWLEIGGDIQLSNDMTHVKIIIKIPEGGVNYFFDDASLVELVPDPNWQTTAANSIDAIRKSQLDVAFLAEQGISLSGIEVEVQQKTIDFGHGTAVKAKLWADPNYGFYKDFVYNTLKPNWAVLENALKWKGMEATKGVIEFEDANATLNDLLDNGLSVRGHAVFWGFEDKVPLWVANIMDPDEMKEAIDNRTASAIGLTKDRLKHWDVDNENLHGDLYARRTGNLNISMDMFRDVHAAEPNAELFLNDYSIVKSGLYTTAMANLAKTYLAAGVPLHGIGIQSHFQSGDIDVTRLKYRLDKVAEAGLPIWITEMSIEENNITAKTEAMDKAMKVFFSYSQVKGVLLWGFWSEAIFESSAALATGTSSITLNAAGQKYVDLVNTDWRTSLTETVPNCNSVIWKSVFKGDYVIKVKKSGTVLKTFEIDLRTDRKLTLWFNGTTEQPEVGHSWVL